MNTAGKVRFLWDLQVISPNHCSGSFKRMSPMFTQFSVWNCFYHVYPTKFNFPFLYRDAPEKKIDRTPLIFEVKEIVQEIVTFLTWGKRKLWFYINNFEYKCCYTKFINFIYCSLTIVVKLILPVIHFFFLMRNTFINGLEDVFSLS